MTPARAVVKYIRDNLVEAHCGCGDVNRGCADVVFHATAAEEKIDAALAQARRATWRAAAQLVTEMEPSYVAIAAALAQRAEGRGE